jgi:hypothetical protein
MRRKESAGGETVTSINSVQQIMTALQTVEAENDNFNLAMEAALPWRFVRLTSHIRAGSLFSANRRN